MDKIVIHVRQSRKGVYVRYVDADSGEIIYDMAFTPVETDRLADIIGGVEKMHAGRFEDVRLSWDVTYDE